MPRWSGEFELELLSLCSEICVFIFNREVFVLAHNTQNCLLFIFSTEAVKQIIDYLGMQPCKRYNRVITEKNSHAPLLVGVLWGGHDVLVQTRQAFDQEVTINITVRNDDPVEPAKGFGSKNSKISEDFRKFNGLFSFYDAGRDIGCQGLFFRSEIFLTLKIVIGDGLKALNTSINSLIPTSAQDRISAYGISTISSRQVMRIWKI